MMEKKKRNLRIVPKHKEDDCIRILKSIVQYYDKIKALEAVQDGSHLKESEIESCAMEIIQRLHIKKYTLADGILILLSALNGLRDEIDRLQKGEADAIE